MAASSENADGNSIMLSSSPTLPPPSLPPAVAPSSSSDPTTTLTVVRDRTISYVPYKDESQMKAIMSLIHKDLSEPYSIYTYRYFIHKWPSLTHLAMDGDKMVGAVVCKLDIHGSANRGYVAMLAVETGYRGHAIGSTLVRRVIAAMIEQDCDEVVLETEITNVEALALYSRLGFVRDKRMFRYYLNGVDAFRLKLWLR